MRKRTVTIKNGIVHIPLSRGEEAIADEQDLHIVSGHNWSTQRKRNTSYAMRNENIDGKNACIYLHREIAKAKEGDIVDHINRNGLDNRRGNIRIATFSQNKCNSKLQKNNVSGYRGVYWRRDREKYQAQIQINGVKIRLGNFKSIDEAHEAYKAASLKYHGEYGRAN